MSILLLLGWVGGTYEKLAVPHDSQRLAIGVNGRYAAALEGGLGHAAGCPHGHQAPPER